VNAGVANGERALQRDGGAAAGGRTAGHPPPTGGDRGVAVDVHAYLIKHGIAVTRTSVYNSLVALADLGVVLRADVGPGAAVYEVADSWHHHFVCGQCGRVSDVDCLVGAKPCLTPGEDVGQVDEAQVIFRGTCRQCLRRQPGRP
jgi:Fe2+ or Zn2+ uptake regulation protein